MIVPIDLLKPILQDLLTIGRPNSPARPWLGLYATEIGDSVAVLGLASRGPAQQADLQRRRHRHGRGRRAGARTWPSLFRRVWSLGQAGVDGAADDQPRGQDVRGQHPLRRPPPLPQGPVLH